MVRGPVLPLMRTRRAETPALPARSIDVFPAPASLVGTRGHQRLTYPPGEGSLTILRRMLPKGLRVSWLSASKGQNLIADWGYGPEF